MGYDRELLSKTATLLAIVEFPSFTRQMERIYGQSSVQYTVKPGSELQLTQLIMFDFLGNADLAGFQSAVQHWRTEHENSEVQPGGDGQTEAEG